MVQYKVFLRDKVIGIASVETENLYTHFICKCSFPDAGIYRILAEFETFQIDLGICVPNGDCFVTRANVPTKRLRKQTPSFVAIPAQQTDFRFVEIEPQNAFLHLSDLASATFSVQDGKKGLLIRVSG